MSRMSGWRSRAGPTELIIRIIQFASAWMPCWKLEPGGIVPPPGGRAPALLIRGSPDLDRASKGSAPGIAGYAMPQAVMEMTGLGPAAFPLRTERSPD